MLPFVVIIYRFEFIYDIRVSEKCSNVSPVPLQMLSGEPQHVRVWNQQETCPEEWNELASDKHNQSLD